LALSALASRSRRSSAEAFATLFLSESLGYSNAALTAALLFPARIGPPE
jgi:hypothetical protein